MLANNGNRGRKPPQHLTSPEPEYVSSGFYPGLAGPDGLTTWLRTRQIRSSVILLTALPTAALPEP